MEFVKKVRAGYNNLHLRDSVAQALAKRPKTKAAVYAAAVVAPVGLLASGGAVESLVGGLGLIAEGYGLYKTLHTPGAGSLFSKAYTTPQIDFVNGQDIPRQLTALKLKLETINRPDFSFLTSNDALKNLLTGLKSNFVVLKDQKSGNTMAYGNNGQTIDDCLSLLSIFIADKYLVTADLDTILAHLEEIDVFPIEKPEVLDQLAEKLAAKIGQPITPEFTAALNGSTLFKWLFTAKKIVAEKNNTSAGLKEANDLLGDINNYHGINALINSNTIKDLIAFRDNLKKLFAPTKETIEGLDVNIPEVRETLAAILTRLNSGEYIPAEDAGIINVITALEGKKPQIEALPNSDQKTALLDSIKKFFVKTSSIKPRPEFLAETLETLKDKITRQKIDAAWNELAAELSNVIAALDNEKEALPTDPTELDEIRNTLQALNIRLGKLAKDGKSLTADQINLADNIGTLINIIGDKLS